MSTSLSFGQERRHDRLSPCIILQNCVNWLGTWKVRGINGAVKKEEVVDVFRTGKFKLLALMEKKLKN